MMNREKIEAGFRMVLEGLGVNPDHPLFRETSARTAESWAGELCAGLDAPEVDLEVMALEEGAQPGLVALNRIPVRSICAHHLLPFIGEATVGYVPGGQICGLAKLSRVVDHFSRRPQLQENLTQQVARFLEAGLGAAGTAVMIRAEHCCMKMRGVNHSGTMTTTLMLGQLKSDPALRAEFMALAQPTASSPPL
ncbi:MAG: GTP cyclohydrolase I [bacterium]